MRAVVHTKYGPPAVLRAEDRPRPNPAAGEILVKVHAASVNRTDCGFLLGKPALVRLFSGLSKPRITILGNEFAGTVEAVGATVAQFTVGQRVFGYNAVSFGGHAEYLTTPEVGMVAEIPPGMTFEQAVPSTEGAHYAMNWIRAAQIKPGHKVLVYGATGAIGSAAVQLLRHFGAHVTAVCETKHVALVETLGPDRLVDYTREDFTRAGTDFDIVMDAVGKSSFRRCKRLLKPGGLYLSSELGFLAQNPFLALVTPLLGSKRVKFPIPQDLKSDVLLLKELMKAGEFAAVIDRSFPLERVKEAFEYVLTGTKVGNVVIRVVAEQP